MHTQGILLYCMTAFKRQSLETLASIHLNNYKRHKLKDVIK